MSHFKKKRGNSTPKISTSSLPDIIFMLLFFFMVVTVMREGERKVQVTVPQATQLIKLEKKSLVNTVYIGKPIKKYQEIYGTQPRVQLDDKFAKNLDGDIALFLEKHKLKVNEQLHGAIITSIKADAGVTMGIVTDVKTALRKANQLKVNYSASPNTDRMNTGL
ncbi:ExbD/TolR family protein [Membranihabitans maritimus]|uniref:ExbD/TolR family protein n=1 Tax=Membranihabitans maritimus TaxID=2904244 RepID=UPI001F334E2C|nr:biopolymer transporter ExbD [Membranihabitans maritimus]